MAWLLHEPRLISSVPVFCIMAIKPLIINHSAPVFVSTGAVRLLKYLHTRLEALLPEIIASTTNNNSNNSMKSASKGSNNALYDAEKKRMSWWWILLGLIWRKVLMLLVIMVVVLVKEIG